MPTQEKPLSASEQQELDSLVAKIEVAYRRRTKADRMGLMWLREIHDRHLYRGHGSFAKFVQEKFCGKSRQWAWHKLIQIEVIENLEPIGIAYISETKAKVLRPFPPEDQLRDCHGGRQGPAENLEGNRYRSCDGNCRGKIQSPLACAGG